MKKLFSLLVIILLLSCSKYNDRATLYKGVESSTFISIEEAKTNVLKLMGQINYETKGSFAGRFIAESFTLGESNITKTDNADPLIYVFNFNDEKGYAIATADKRMPPVFCITEKGYFSPDSLIVPEGAVMLLSALEDEYRRVSTGGKRGGDSLDIIDPPGGNPTHVDTWYVYSDWEMGPLYGSQLCCNWDQRGPFNDQCPLDGGFNVRLDVLLQP